jgi:cystathionine beta-lyase/cystathionine gamma-synthase
VYSTSSADPTGFVNVLLCMMGELMGVRSTTRAVFVETPTNPLMRVIDLEPLATLCHTEGSALIVDSTFASPINLRPIEHGADVVIHSATKYLNGHSDVIAGAVAGTEEVVEEVRQLMHVWGPALDPHAAWLVERGLKTLDVRMARHNANGLAFAEWAAGEAAFTRVHYPGLPAHPDHATAALRLDGFGGMVSLELAGGAAAAERMLRRLRIAQHAPLTPEQRAAQGMPDGLVRVSLGIEDVEDIIADFARALRQPSRA